MYYLLEDNTIMDSENLPKNWKIFSISFDKMYVKIFEDIIITQTFNIKKQSENVYDLIEVGDLVQTNYGSLRDVRGLQSDSVVIQYDCCIYFENIIAIYKPNSNGDYIKVWEKKENEQKRNRM